MRTTSRVEAGIERPIERYYKKYKWSTKNEAEYCGLAMLYKPLKKDKIPKMANINLKAIL